MNYESGIMSKDRDKLVEKIDESKDPNYWKSFEELHGDKEFIEANHHEFLSGVKDDFDPEKDLSGLSRRKFLALVGAGAALAATGCSDYRDKGEIVAYNRKPEDIIVGQANFYASTCTACELTCGILIKTREGRPIKSEGNPDHPVNVGKICSRGQAHVLNLYDPSRLREPKANIGSGNVGVWKDIDEEVVKVLKSSGTKEIAVILPKVVSPTFRKVLADFQVTYPSTKFYVFEASNNSAKRSAWKKSYPTGANGRSLSGAETAEMPLIDLSKANIILALEGDFIGLEGNTIENTRMFAQKRNVNDAKNFSRLYAAESVMSVTGANADYRLRVKPEQQTAFVLGLINEIALREKKSEITLDSSSQSLIEQFPLHKVIKEIGLEEKSVKLLVRDLIKNKQSSYVFAGKVLSEQTHIAVNLLNEVIGAKALYRKDTAEIEYMPAAEIASFGKLAAEIRSGNVSAVICVDVNPAYSLPRDTGFAEVLEGFKGLSVTLTEFDNETASASKYVLPIHHTFEAWGDAQGRTSVISTQQPVIAPLFLSRQKEGILLAWASGKSDSYSENLYHTYLMKNWESSIFPKLKSALAFDKFWLGVLHDGVVVKAESIATVGSMTQSALAKINKPSATSAGLSLLITESYQLGADSKYAQNGWLQEFPHPVTKVTWDNYASMSEKTSKKYDVKSNDVVEIAVNGKKVSLPVLMQPGMADDIVSIETGYGRTKSALVALNVGQDVNSLLTKTNTEIPYYFTGVTVTKTGKVSKLASSQDHHTYDEALIQDIHKKREIIREGTVAEFIKDEEFLRKEVEKKPEPENMYTEMAYNDVKWGMVIDLNKCTGCGDCITACNVENNVPVVGKDQVLNSREMQWLRIDRYYSGKPENAQVSVQPMLCQHCDQAPCENVCPVVATNHSPDGLNQMVYNRCVGTRYCSNNCPYKVRRFNFFNFRDHFHDGHYQQVPMKLASNPEVTLRSRGVMEKCTFCIHRIAEGRADAAKEGKVFDGKGVTSACQDACSASAIVFGNVNDSTTEVSKMRKHHLGYHVLEDLNIRPNVTYIAKLRNIEEEEA